MKSEAQLRKDLKMPLTKAKGWLFILLTHKFQLVVFFPQLVF